MDFEAFLKMFKAADPEVADYLERAIRALTDPNATVEDKLQLLEEMKEYGAKRWPEDSEFLDQIHEIMRMVQIQGTPLLSLLPPEWKGTIEGAMEAYKVLYNADDSHALAFLCGMQWMYNEMISTLTEGDG